MEGQTDKLLDRTLHTLALVILNPTHYTPLNDRNLPPFGHYSDLNCLSCDFTGLPRNLPNPFVVREVPTLGDYFEISVSSCDNI